jgi:hypothetical protein
VECCIEQYCRNIQEVFERYFVFSDASLRTLIGALAQKVEKKIADVCDFHAFIQEMFPNMVVFLSKNSKYLTAMV